MTNDNHVNDQLSAYLSDELKASEVIKINEHLAMCDSCRQEFESLGGVWNAIGDMSEEQPSKHLRSRFYEAMDAYEAALQGKSFSQTKPARSWYEILFQNHPVVQFGLALLLVIVGGFIGYRLRGESVNEAQIVQIRDEVRTVNRLLTVSLLQQQSASERLQGVNRSYQLEYADPEITNALLQTFKYDPNVNVRLAALDALSRNISQPDVRRELLKAFQSQSSPMVQIAIVDLMVQVREKNSMELLKQMLQKSDVNRAVKKRIEEGIQQLNS
jgi:hypothetical protein